MDERYLQHHGILGQKWYVRRYQNPDGSLTSAGRERYGVKGERGESRTKKMLSSTGKVIKRAFSPPPSKNKQETFWDRVKNMSDEELKNATSRINAENTYHDALLKQADKKTSKVKKILSKAIEEGSSKALNKLMDKVVDGTIGKIGTKDKDAFDYKKLDYNQLNDPTKRKKYLDTFSPKQIKKIKEYEKEKSEIGWIVNPDNLWKMQPRK